MNGRLSDTYFCTGIANEIGVKRYLNQIEQSQSTRDIDNPIKLHEMIYLFSSLQEAVY
jgi:hypothetical protein